MPQYTIELRQKDGDVIADLSGIARNRKWHASRNRAESCIFTVNLADLENYAEEAKIDISEFFNINANEILIRRNSEYLFTCVLRYVEPKSTKNSIEVEFRGVGIFDELTRAIAGISSPRAFTSTDAGTIAKTLIDEFQALTNGSLGITTNASYIETTTARTISYDRKKVSEAISDLASMDDGFDFEFTYDKKFYVYASMGEDKTERVVFEYPKNLKSFTLPIDGIHMVNQVYARGAGFGDSQIVVGPYSNTSSQTTHRLKQDILEYPDIEESALLTAKAQEYLARFADKFKLPTFVFDGNISPEVKKDYWIGDTVTVNILKHSAFVDFNTNWRVESLDVNISDEGSEEVVVAVSPAS